MPYVDREQKRQHERKRRVALKQLSGVFLDRETYAEIVELARKQKISISKMVQQLIEWGLEDETSRPAKRPEATHPRSRLYDL